MKRAVVIGAGHNGLTTAALLAQAGVAVTVVERRSVVGGLAARETFGDGFETTGLLQDTSGVRQAVIDALKLEGHGLKRRGPLVQVGPGVRIEGGAISGDIDPADQENFAQHRAFIERVRGAVEHTMNSPAPEPLGSILGLLKTGWQIRKLGAKDMTELLRIAPMCVADWMRDRFATERVRAFLSGPALEGSFFGPWSAGSAANLLLRLGTAGREIEGGPAALTDALLAAAKAQGVTVRTDAEVVKINLGATATGVTLADGTVVEGAVVASCDPKHTFLKLLGPRVIPSRLAQDVRNIRARGTTAKVNLGLSAPLTVDGKPFDVLRTGETLDDLERAFDAAKYGGFSERPLLEVRQPNDKVASVLVHFAAYDRRGGWSDEAREQLGDVVVAELARMIPGVTDRIVAREVLTPVDIEARYRVTQGHIHHGEHAPDQLLFMRPTIQCARHETPIPGLWLCGSGTHPGGGITCAPGLLAAHAILGKRGARPSRKLR